MTEPTDVQNSSVCVVGLGYIGLPTASLLATRRFPVRGVDLNARTVDTINRGRVHIAEPDLDVLVMSAVQSGLLVAATEPAPADVFVIAVPTPLGADHQPDISAVEAATRSIAPHVVPGNLVILESTSPVGTTEKVARWLIEQRPDLVLPLSLPKAEDGSGTDQVYVAHCPERVLPGSILRELVDNDRIVGGLDRASGERAREFYASFVGGDILVTDAATAEATKLVENAFRDVNVAFANELAQICEELGIDVWEVIGLANHHPRVNILRPGPGVGGHCIPIDPWFLIRSAGERARLLRAARQVNDDRPHRIVAQVLEAAGRLEEPVLACLGLAYKSDVDDLRESPSLEIVRLVAGAAVGEVLAVEPYRDALPAQLQGLPRLLFTDLETALERADVVVALVGHKQFQAVPAERLRGKVVIDACGLWHGPRASAPKLESSVRVR